MPTGADAKLIALRLSDVHMFWYSVMLFPLGSQIVEHRGIPDAS
jgi:hypothetical protein